MILPPQMQKLIVHQRSCLSMFNFAAMLAITVEDYPLGAVVLNWKYIKSKISVQFSCSCDMRLFSLQQFLFLLFYPTDISNLAEGYVQSAHSTILLTMMRLRSKKKDQAGQVIVSRLSLSTWYNSPAGPASPFCSLLLLQLRSGAAVTTAQAFLASKMQQSPTPR